LKEGKKLLANKGNHGLECKRIVCIYLYQVKIPLSVVLGGSLIWASGLLADYFL